MHTPPHVFMCIHVCAHVNNGIWTNISHSHDVVFQVLPTFYFRQGLSLTWTFHRLSWLAYTTKHNFLSVLSFYNSAQFSNLLCVLTVWICLEVHTWEHLNEITLEDRGHAHSRVNILNIYSSVYLLIEHSLCAYHIAQPWAITHK